MTTLLETDAVTLESWLSESDERTLANDVLDGLTRPFKELPPKHFYDARGSELFEQICELPEYYPTRTEMAILTAAAPVIVAETGAGELVELGSGASAKARILLDAMAAVGTLRRYVPFDVSESVVRDAADVLIGDYEGLRVHGVVGDFERHLERVPPRDGVPRIVALLGGTIGNFPPGTRRGLLRSIASILREGDRFLLGTDLVKDPEVIEAAYDDTAGVTAEFNRNVLHVINRELGADFPVDNFDHIAFFDRRHEWVEMRLRARRPCSVFVAAVGLRVEFAAGEELQVHAPARAGGLRRGRAGARDVVRRRRAAVRAVARRADLDTRSGLQPEAADALFVPAEVVGDLVSNGPGHLGAEQLRVVPEVAHQRVAEDDDALVEVIVGDRVALVEPVGAAPSRPAEADGRAVVGHDDRNVLERAMEFQRQLVERGPDERLEVLILVEVEPHVVIVVVTVEAVTGVAPVVVRSEAFASLDERFELGLGLRIPPAGEADESKHNRSANDQGPQPEHCDPLHEADEPVAAEAAEKTQQPHAEDRCHACGERCARHARRRSAHPLTSRSGRSRAAGSRSSPRRSA
jgi:L-histidine N-alpha-methyltransferase